MRHTHLRAMPFPVPPVIPVSPIALAQRNVDHAAATFLDQAIRATTVDDLLRLRDQLGEQIRKLAGVELAILDRANRIEPGDWR